eukprot:985_1
MDCIDCVYSLDELCLLFRDIHSQYCRACPLEEYHFVLGIWVLHWRCLLYISAYIHSVFADHNDIIRQTIICVIFKDNEHGIESDQFIEIGIQILSFNTDYDRVHCLRWHWSCLHSLAIHCRDLRVNTILLHYVI